MPGPGGRVLCKEEVEHPKHMILDFERKDGGGDVLFAYKLLKCVCSIGRAYNVDT